ncbi:MULTISPECIES: SDR family oxidoreductase [unclassified Streptomyces]|uniref:SDR family NAD(P)-dependent oxidoreductase n=1 Tax=unclassified Streptomyces TaxID=2593676 RepID=UPI002DDA0A40|nr:MULTISPECIES: SDR family oxidoreductase [unclassified Streptomyces]WSA95944.1 SDR family oxidoreductase [Streptomyces sp. NBC_01795]WSB80359.1 SDR family oxidoreductase [Streptomyces sp. NBC_01775]WSS40144.1 SDR family oxidoreductase [Streptomyces sp. NBC_01187]
MSAQIPRNAQIPRFAGQCAVVTGAAAGIGAATAHRLAAEGAAVVVADIDAAGAAAVAEAVRADGGRAASLAADVATEEGWARVLRAADGFGPVSVLVSNAVKVEVAPAHETATDSWQRQLDVGLTAAFLGVRACLPGLRAHDLPGAVVLVSSVHARHGIPGHPAYAAAKGGLLSLSSQLAVEYGPRVRVNAVLPGPVLTRLWDRVPEEERRASAEQTTARRLGDPSEVAAAIAFLAAPEASYVSGTSLVVDGGWSVVKSSA